MAISKTDYFVRISIGWTRWRSKMVQFLVGCFQLKLTIRKPDLSTIQMFNLVLHFCFNYKKTLYHNFGWDKLRVENKKMLVNELLLPIEQDWFKQVSRLVYRTFPTKHKIYLKFSATGPKMLKLYFKDNKVLHYKRFCLNASKKN
jgi:hypothetical protein